MPNSTQQDSGELTTMYAVRLESDGALTVFNNKHYAQPAWHHHHGPPAGDMVFELAERTAPDAVQAVERTNKVIYEFERS